MAVHKATGQAFPLGKIGIATKQVITRQLGARSPLAVDCFLVLTTWGIMFGGSTNVHNVSARRLGCTGWRSGLRWLHSRCWRFFLRCCLSQIYRILAYRLRHLFLLHISFFASRFLWIGCAMSHVPIPISDASWQVLGLILISINKV